MSSTVEAPLPAASAAPAVTAAARPRVFSGIQPSGNLHIGNYLGAIKNWVGQQALNDNVFCIVNLHALSLPTTRDQLAANTIDLANTLLACGLDPAQCIIFVQSDVREHSELCWLLMSVTQFGELRRMTQFKDKAGGRDEQVSAALFTYPVLQAADILLYDTNLVPVGEDQKQHIEITRDIAARFNARYGDTFVLPAADIKEAGARIMALDNPAKKMSKSDANPMSAIALTDPPDQIRKKIMRAVTDSGSEVVASPEKPALTNLLTIYSLFADEPIPVLTDRYAGKGYGAFKKDLADVIIDALATIQPRLLELQADPSIALTVMAEGADRARHYAAAKMTVVRDRMGIAVTAGQ